MKCAHFLVTAILSVGIPATSFAEVGFQQDSMIVVDTLPNETAVLNDGTMVDVAVQRVWKPICGSDLSQMDRASFEQTIDELRAHFDQAAAPAMARSSAGGFDIIFNITTTLPAGAQDAVNDVEAFIESQFDDPVTITINFGMQNMGSGVLGSTGSNYISSNYPTVRDNIRADMDFDDFIQDWLPDTTTIPVRYNASTATVTNENRVFVTRANFNAAIGTVSGTAASMTLNTNFNWDYDPSNGILASRWDFQSVLVHEVGHALGFTSGVDFRNNDIEMLDLYRFQRTDGSGDYNPDDFAEFQTTPRTADFNNPNDDANSDLVTIEYRMEDGTPRQASHFRDNLGIGIMDPTLGANQSFYPDFFRTADLDMFDAIGWDVLSCSIGPDSDDLNDNGIDDLCEQDPPSIESFGLICDLCPNGAECVDGTCYAPKNRYLSIVPSNPGSLTALRVLHTVTGRIKWVGEPDDEGFATLVDAPEFYDWSGYQLPIHVGGCLITPVKTYDVQSILEGYDTLEEDSYSTALTVPTATDWGDVIGSGDSLPDGTANFADITAVVDCFKELPTALGTERCELAPQIPDGVSNFTDINFAVSAFKDEGYPFSAPLNCP